MTASPTLDSGRDARSVARGRYYVYADSLASMELDAQDAVCLVGRQEMLDDIVTFRACRAIVSPQC